MTASTASPQPHTVVPSEVGWQFVPQYYTFVNKDPGRLHCFYNKTSTFVHGTEGEEGKTCVGQQVCFFILIPSLHSPYMLPNTLCLVYLDVISIIATLYVHSFIFSDNLSGNLPKNHLVGV